MIIPWRNIQGPIILRIPKMQNPQTKKMSNGKSKQIPQSPTGIKGLDAITYGGFPEGRQTLICGGVACGKTLLGMEFLVRNAMQFNEPGVFLTFEETADDLTQNAASFGCDLQDLIACKKLMLDYVPIERSRIRGAK